MTFFLQDVHIHRDIRKFWTTKKIAVAERRRTIFCISLFRTNLRGSIKSERIDRGLTVLVSLSDASCYNQTKRFSRGKVLAKGKIYTCIGEVKSTRWVFPGICLCKVDIRRYLRPLWGWEFLEGVRLSTFPEISRDYHLILPLFWFLSFTSSCLVPSHCLVIYSRMFYQIICTF